MIQPFDPLSSLTLDNIFVDPYTQKPYENPQLVDGYTVDAVTLKQTGSINPYTGEYVIKKRPDVFMERILSSQPLPDSKTMFGFNGLIWKLLDVCTNRFSGKSSDEIFYKKADNKTPRIQWTDRAVKWYHPGYSKFYSRLIELVCAVLLIVSVYNNSRLRG